MPGLLLAPELVGLHPPPPRPDRSYWLSVALQPGDGGLFRLPSRVSGLAIGAITVNITPDSLGVAFPIEGSGDNYFVANIQFHPSQGQISCDDGRKIEREIFDKLDSTFQGLRLAMHDSLVIYDSIGVDSVLAERHQHAPANFWIASALLKWTDVSVHDKEVALRRYVDPTSYNQYHSLAHSTEELHNMDFFLLRTHEEEALGETCLLQTLPKRLATRFLALNSHDEQLDNKAHQWHFAFFGNKCCNIDWPSSKYKTALLESQSFEEHDQNGDCDPTFLVPVGDACPSGQQVAH